MKPDIVVIGGGISGLSLSVDLKQRGFDVILIEKGSYPRHKVCGEYISMESRKYLEKICPVLIKLTLPQINRFRLSSTGGEEFRTTLDLGGFGISRYLLETLLFSEAERLGVKVIQHCKVTGMEHDKKSNAFHLTTSSGVIDATLVCNASGRKSNLETKNSPVGHQPTNYVGVKYHIKIERDPSIIEIHNFEGGYCGISNIEDGRSCLCYIVNASKLKLSGNSIPEMERTYLYKNRNLKKIFREARFITEIPVTVSGINFLVKQPVYDSTLYLGDAAGSIAPLTGNGMSMGLRSASALAAYIHDYYVKEQSFQSLTSIYSDFWKKEFSTRIKMSRYLQKLSESPLLAKSMIKLMNTFPPLSRTLIRSTHGQPF